MAKTILVTGAAGFLGSHICKELLNRKYEVIGVDNLLGGDKENIPFLYNFYKLDCADFKSMLKITKGIDVLFHCAATAHEGLSVFSPYTITQNNIMATVGVATAAIQNGVKRIIYCSSMARYGDQQSPFTEDMPTKPVDPYGISKVAGEEILKTLCKVHGVELVIAVPHNIIGPNQKYNDPFRNAVSIFINRMLQGKPPIIYGDGMQTRCFSYVDDCLSSLLKMVEDPCVVGQVINIGPDEEFVTIKEVAETCANLTGFNGDFEYVPDRPQEVKHAVCSSDKARRILKYKTTTKLHKAIQETYEFIKEQGPKPFNYYLNLEIINEKTPKTWTEKKI